MIRYVFSLAFVLMMIISCSSSGNEFEIKDTEVPPPVMAAFKARYPQATDAKWQAEKDEGKFFFEVDFKDGGKEKEVQITPDGSSVSE